MPEASAPPSPQQGPYYPPAPPPLVWNTFGGIDTQSSRPAINDKQCAIIDGFFPEGDSNLRTLPGVGDAVYSTTASTIVKFGFLNIGATPYGVVFLANGAIEAFNTSTGGIISIAAAGTITNPGVNTIGLTQWANKYAVITADQGNGFWLWDGTSLFQPGTLGPDINLNNTGTGYTSAPTVTAFGGSGSGASFSVTMQNNFVQSISVTSPGISYSSVDGVILAFSGGGLEARTALISLNVSGGSISSASIIDGGAGYTDNSALYILGGGGAGASLTMTVGGGSVTAVNVAAGGSGFSGNPIAYVQDANNPVAQATANIMPTGISGTAAEVYESRLWVAKGRRIQYTAPGTLSNFNSSSGGGAFESTDSFLRDSFTGLKQTNGFLFMIADSSMNYISGVTTSSGTSTSAPSTTFTNQNADPEIGSSWAPTIDVFSRNIIFANSYGVHVSYGGALTKVSDALDGIWGSVENFGGITPSCAKAVIYGKKVWMILLPVVDQMTGQQINKLLLWNGAVWFSSQQDVNLVQIAGQELNSVLTAYGSTGSRIYPLFRRASTGFVKTVRSKLWDRPGYMWSKLVGRLWGLASYYSLNSPGLSVQVDNETGTVPTAISLAPNVAAWTNVSGDTVAWVNHVGVSFTWYASGSGVVVFPATAVGQQGVLIGFTVQTSAADMALISLAVDDVMGGYRG